MFRAIRYGVSAARALHTGRVNLADLKLIFATPTEVFYDDKVVKQVDVQTLSGSFGILAQHVPTIACLKPGVVTVVQTDDVRRRIFVSSGTVTVNADSSVQILAEEASAIDKIDFGVAKEGLARTQQELNAARNEAERAEKQIAIEAYEAVLRAESG